MAKHRRSIWHQVPRKHQPLVWLVLLVVALAVAWSLVGNILSLTLGQVLIVALAFGAGYWVRGWRGR